MTKSKHPKPPFPEVYGGEVGLFETLPTRWYVSAAVSKMRFNCTPDHIIEKCGGHCCHNPHYWPPKSFEGGVCEYLGKQGCTLDPLDRPIGCLFFPFALSREWKLNMYFGLRFKHSKCNEAYGTGPLLIDALNWGLVAIFGQEQYDRVRADVMSGKDGHFDLSEELIEQYKREYKWEMKNIKPIPRRQRS